MNGWSASVKTRLGAFDLDISIGGDTAPVALVGPNGSGKTTALRVLAGSVHAEQAEISVQGRVIESTDKGIRMPIERRRVGYVPQGYGLFPHLTVLDNVAFGLSTGPNRVAMRARRSRARQVLDELGCADLVERRVDRLSGGEQQRVALARALVLDPDLLLLDEPLAALDATRRRAVRGFLADRLTAFARPSIIVTHDVRDVAALGATIVVLDNGRVVQTGPLDAVQRAPANDFVAEFVGADG